MLTFNEIGKLDQCDNPARLWKYVLKIARQYGFRATVYACPPPHRKPTHPDTIIRYVGLSDEQFQKFAITGLIEQGHITTENSLSKGSAFRWTEIANLTNSRQLFENLKQDANSADIDEGWIFPVFGPQSRNGLASYGKPNSKRLMDSEAGLQCHIFAQMAHLRFCQLTSDLYGIDKSLSKREMQIIAWAAKGKSNSEIGTILKLSESSIDSYMRRAFTKLGVHDRTSASVKAISMDLVRT
ncbi:LuxR family transcriptional regulator [Sphingorhabdus sp. EL138]|jgi:LuxR family transcriptional regulator/LuxR family quorum-sensing system transcriptional regulator CciR|uniref:helix-turn-helix transcriptional regulator n=1 Tax=Sphingorhabdus sp. EL138 TaxID=2073156 RepID=UPI000D6998CA|nr:LuxR family transcriptional regulator [Sphingorhabdus sp. EL138]